MEWYVRVRRSALIAGLVLTVVLAVFQSNATAQQGTSITSSSEFAVPSLVTGTTTATTTTGSTTGTTTATLTPSPTVTPTATATPIVTMTLTSTVTATATATPTFTATATATATPTVAACQVSAFITSVTLIRATDRATEAEEVPTDQYTWSKPFVIVNGVSNENHASVQGFATGVGERGGLEEGDQDPTDHPIFENTIVGIKGDPVDVTIVLTNRETDLRIGATGGANDLGAAVRIQRIADACTTERVTLNMVVQVQAFGNAQMPGPGGAARPFDSNDKFPLVNGRLRVRIVFDIDP